MLTDNRLDFISDIKPEYVDLMTHTRKEFIALDGLMVALSKDENFNRNNAARCVSLARTHIETALQYAIKSLCLMGEKKDNDE
jgi:hypothetical protein